MTAGSYSQLYGRRFTQDEQMAFGRYAHLNARSRTLFAKIAGQNLGAPSKTSFFRPLARESGSDLQEDKVDPESRLALVGGRQARSASEPRLMTIEHGSERTMRPGPQSSDHEDRCGFDHSQLRSVLEQLLPAGDFDIDDNETAPDSMPGESALLPTVTTAADRRRRYGVMADGPGATEVLLRQSRRGRNARSCRHVLEDFRRLLLQKFRSLFDAFERVHDLAKRENALTLDEFCQVFAQLGIKESEALETFTVMDFKSRELVSLPALRIALACTSKQALMWELRCRLLTQGITPNDLSKVKKILEIARRPRHRTVRQRRRAPLGYGLPGLFNAAALIPDMPDSAADADAEWGAKCDAVNTWVENCENIGFLPASSRLSRMDWLQLCAAIGLTIVEAERLFPILLDPKTGMVDLREMFKVLRADVAPHVSLERFATRVLTRYGSLQNAFAAVCAEASAASDRDTGTTTAGVPRVMYWPEFHKLAADLDVNDSNVEQLWSTLTLAQFNLQRENNGNAVETMVVASPSRKRNAINAERRAESVTETVFVQELAVWAPGTALGALRNQVDEHFSDLGELRHALGQTGFVMSAPIIAEELDSALMAVGIRGCNVERICSDVRSAKRGGLSSNVTLDDILEALKNNGATRGSAAQSAVRDDLRPFWQRLHSWQADLQNSNVEPIYESGMLSITDSTRSSFLQLEDEPTAALLQIADRSPQRASLHRAPPHLRSSASLPSLRNAGSRKVSKIH